MFVDGSKRDRSVDELDSLSVFPFNSSMFRQPQLLAIVYITSKKSVSLLKLYSLMKKYLDSCLKKGSFLV